MSVPDVRLDRITAHVQTQKVIPAVLKLVDIAGIVQGASEGQGLGNKFLAHIREVDAILQVVRCFDDPDVIHVAGKVDPVADMETIEMETTEDESKHAHEDAGMSGAAALAAGAYDTSLQPDEEQRGSSSD